MKTKLCQLNFPFVLVLFVSCLAQQVLGSQSVSISIIWDRHSDGRPHWSTFQSLSMQAITCLNPGDYLEIITADPDKPHLRVAQYIKSGDEFNSIYTILNNITCPLIANTDMADALELAFKRQNRTSSANPDIVTGFLVLTKGNLSSREVKHILNLLHRYRRENWHLYITGTYDTNISMKEYHTPNCSNKWPERPKAFPDLMTPLEAAMFLRLDETGHTPQSAKRTLNYWRDQDELRATKYARYVWYLKEELESFLINKTEK